MFVVFIRFMLASAVGAKSRLELRLLVELELMFCVSGRAMLASKL